MQSNTQKTICLLAYDGLELLDLSGPQSAFYEAEQYQKGSYRLQVIGFSNQPIWCEAGLQITPTVSIDDVESCHTLIIPGGKGSRSSSISEADLDNLQALMERSERVVSICTGAFLLANAGIPDNTKVATHWAFVDMFKAQYPLLDVEPDKLYINEGKYWSSAGVTSGIDLSMRLIELDLGKQAAHHVAKSLVVYLQRTGNQKQFSDLLDVQSPKNERIKTLANWIKENIAEDISVITLAEQLHLSERQCHRLFVTETGLTPATYVEKLRMQVASDLLATTDKEIKAIALAIGFGSYDGFRRAFERNFSVCPSTYRQAFHTESRA